MTPEQEPRFALEIEGKLFTNWTEVELEQSLDGFSTLAFTAPFEPERKEFRDVFRPFSFKSVGLKIDDELQFTGFLVSVQPELSPQGSTVKVQAYARPATLGDCDIGWNPETGTNSPLNYRGLDLRAIATALCKPFGIEAKFDERAQGAFPAKTPSPAERDRAFPKVRIEPGGSKILDFLCTLARQIGLVMTDDAQGNLLFTRSVPLGGAEVVARLEEGTPPLLSVTPSFNPEGYYSDVTVLVAKKRGQEPGRWTAVNPFLKDVVRPVTYRLEDVPRGGAEAAANDYVARMIGSAASWELELPSIRDTRGRLFRPNTLLQLQAPGAMIYRNCDFLVRNVTKRQSTESTTCKLGIVMPGIFSGEVPPKLPWDEAV